MNMTYGADPWWKILFDSKKTRNIFGQEPNNQEYELGGIPNYDHYHQQTADDFRIDGITWNDLEMDKIFRRINLCESSVGEEYLYSLLHYPCAADDKQEEREELIQWLVSHPEDRIQIQDILYHLGRLSYNGLPFYLFHADTKKLKNRALYYVLGALPAIFALVTIFNEPLGIIGLVFSVLINLIVYHAQKIFLDAEIRTMHYLLALLACANRLLKYEKLDWNHNVKKIKLALPAFRKIGGSISGLMHRQIDIIDALIQFIKALFMWDIIQYDKVIRIVARHSSELNEIYQGVAELDVSHSIASFRHSLPLFCTAQYTEENKIIFEDLYHPLLKNAVQNSGEISRNSIITGSNASGKSTFLKSLAVNAILAMTIHTCCATKFVLRRSPVLTSMALRDNIVSGESYFITEIKSLKRILERIRTGPCICFIDEILRGTNTYERIAASIAVLKNMDKHSDNCLCVIATHDLELTVELQSSFDNLHFSEIFEDNKVNFDYKLKNGPARTMNAILLLEALGFDPEIIEAARSNYARIQNKY